MLNFFVATALLLLAAVGLYASIVLWRRGVYLPGAGQRLRLSNWTDLIAGAVCVNAFAASVAQDRWPLATMFALAAAMHAISFHLGRSPRKVTAATP